MLKGEGFVQAVRGEEGGEQIGLSIYKQKGQTFDRFASGQAWEIWQQQLS